MLKNFQSRIKYSAFSFPSVMGCINSVPVKTRDGNDSPNISKSESRIPFVLNFREITVGDETEIEFIEFNPMKWNGNYYPPKSEEEDEEECEKIHVRDIAYKIAEMVDSKGLEIPLEKNGKKGVKLGHDGRFLACRLNPDGDRDFFLFLMNMRRSSFNQCAIFINKIERSKSTGTIYVISPYNNEDIRFPGIHQKVNYVNLGIGFHSKIHRILNETDKRYYLQEAAYAVSVLISNERIEAINLIAMRAIMGDIRRNIPPKWIIPIASKHGREESVSQSQSVVGSLNLPPEI